MKRSKIFIYSFIACSFALSTQAKVVTPSQAKAFAAKYVNVGNDVMKAFNVTETQQTDAPEFYAFNDKQGKGFVIIAGDDCVQPVLGYSHSGNIDTNNLPPAMKAWLNNISTFIANERANNNGIAKSAVCRENDSQPTVVVAPIIKTKWDQSQPYYDMTPTKKGEHSLTGCVATATAQVMNYYQWPKHGYGSVNYDISGFDQSSINADFTQSKYDWDNMLNEYTYNSTSTEGEKTPQWSTANGEAVARLMSDLGSALHMQYGTIADGGSGAYNPDIVTAAVYNFGYNAEIFSKRNYSMKQWIKLIEGNLDAGLPLVYGGLTPKKAGQTQSGHCFVVDGYNSDNYMHVNWGWSGSGDGYFYFYTFGVDDNYNYSSDMVFVKLTPNKSETIEWDAAAPLNIESSYSYICQNDKVVDGKFITTDVDNLNADLNLLLPYVSWDNYKGNVTLGYSPEDGGDFTPLKSIDNVESDIRDEQLVTKQVRFHIDGSDISSIADGKYVLSVKSQREASGLSKNGAPVSDSFNDESLALMLIKQGNNVGLGFLNRNTTQLTASSKISTDKTEYDISDIATFKTNIKNNTDKDYNSGLYLKIVNTNGQIAMLKVGDLTLYGGDEKILTCPIPVYASEGLAEGTYKLSFAQVIDGNYADVEGCEPITIKVSRNDDKLPELELSEFELLVNDKPVTDFNNLEFNKYDIFYITAKIKNKPIITMPEFMYMKVFNSFSIDDSDISIYAAAGFNEEYIDKDNMKLSFEGDIEDDWVGMTGRIEVGYIPMFDTALHYFTYNGKEMNIKFKVVDKTSGVNDVKSNDKAKETMRFDALGRCISAPAKGLNIIKMSDGTVRKEIVK